MEQQVIRTGREPDVVLVARPVADLPQQGRVSQRIGRWVHEHRPATPIEGRSTFVILAAVTIGIGMLFEPGYFFALAAVFALLAWWRRESARSGLRDVVVGAFILGAIALVVAIAYYFVMPLFVS